MNGEYVMKSEVRTFASRIKAMFSRRREDEEFSDEIREHLDMLTEENVRRGMPLSVARREAKIGLGGTTQLRETHRELTGISFLETLIQDIRYALRMLRKAPSFTTVAVLTIALGIGANTAIFSVVDWLILRPLPIDHPGQVIFFETSWKNGSAGTQFSYPDIQKIQQQTSGVFSDSAALQMFQMDGLSVDGKSQPIWSDYVTGDFFTLLGIKPALGRFILPSEGKVAGADAVLVISYSYWKSRFDADPNIIGKKVSVNGHPMTIVGVAPENFHGIAGLLDTQGYMPLAMASTLQDASETFLTDPKDTNLRLIARLRTGVTLRQAQPMLQVVAQRLSRADEEHGGMTVLASPLGPVSMTSGPNARPELDLVSSLFLILAGAVLVLACMNIANLCLARVAARQREVALRAALGATRGRLIRQLLTESLLLALLGCVAGIILGVAASSSFGSISLHTAIPTVLDFRFDWRVFAYAFAGAVLTGVLVGITPALRVSRTDLNEVLHEGGRTSTGGRQRLRNVFVVAQVAGSLVLLIVAGLFVRSLEKIQHADLGFDPSHVLNASIDPHEAGYGEAQAREFQKTLLARARALPGVKAASLAWTVPMGYSSYGTHLKIDGYQTHPGEDAPAAGFNAVSPGYFETMSIPLLQGRGFRDSDDQKSQRVAIVNQNFADQYWHGQYPIGRHFSMLDDSGPAMEVVGVVRNSRDDDIFTSNDPFFYVPLAQDYNSLIMLQLRAVSTPESLAPEVTGLVHSLEPAIPVFDVQSMATALDSLNGLLLFQFAAALAGALGILGLLLALVGVYGVISFAAGQRTHEIGIRLALGAQPMQILKLIFRQGFLIVGIGVLIGIFGAAAMGKLVANFLFGVSPVDALTFASTSLLLAAVALLACYIPARRAMKVDPMVALRYE